MSEKNGVHSPEQKLAEMSIKNLEVTRDQLRSWLVDDLKRVHVTVSEILRSPQVIDTLTDIYYKRYEAMKAQPELQLNSEK